MSRFTGSYKPMRRPPNRHCLCKPGGWLRLVSTKRARMARCNPPTLPPSFVHAMRPASGHGRSQQGRQGLGTPTLRRLCVSHTWLKALPQRRGALLTRDGGQCADKAPMTETADVLSARRGQELLPCMRLRGPTACAVRRGPHAPVLGRLSRFQQASLHLETHFRGVQRKRGRLGNTRCNGTARKAGSQRQGGTFGRRRHRSRWFNTGCERLQSAPTERPFEALQ